MKIIHALDFDGVLCDSVIETAITAWRLSQDIWKDMPKIDISQEKINDFREIRPFLKTGYEAILIMRLLYLGISIKEICDNYQVEIEKLIDQENLDIMKLKKLFGEARDQWIAKAFNEWIAINPLFDGVIDFLNSLNKEHLYIVTTKQERFVKYILKANGIELENEKIFGLDRGMSKVDILLKIQHNHPDSEIRFIEDYLPALSAVMEEKKLDKIQLQLVSWGYNTSIDREKAMDSKRIRLMFSFSQEIEKRSINFINSYLEQLKLLSQTVLKSDFLLFWKSLKRLKKHKEFYFLERYEDVEDYYLNPYINPYYTDTKEGGLEHGEDYYFPFERYFLDQATDEEGFDKMLDIHWGGEHKEGDFSYFVQRSLNYYGVNFDIAFWEQESKAIRDKIKLEKGNYLLYQFEVFDKELKAIDFYLMFIDCCSDTHYPIVVNQEEQKKLNGLRVGSFTILDAKCYLA